MIDNKIAVYFCVLNQGEIAVELAQCINSILSTSEFPIFVDYSCEKPISFNRNQIVKRFLERPQYDYLIMLDSDIVPTANYLNLINFKKDIISGLCFAFTKKNIFPLILKHSKEKITGNKYRAYDSLHPDKWTGLVEVDAVGTGAVILSRKVLEAIPYPFRNEYDKTGNKQIGLDLNFCRRAKKLGFQVWCHTDYVCSHHTRFDLKSVYYTMRQAYKEIDDLKNENRRIKRELDKRKIVKRSKVRTKIIGNNNRKKQGDGVIRVAEGENVPTGGNNIPEVSIAGHDNNSGTEKINTENIQ
jgi:hypothetical protein